MAERIEVTYIREITELKVVILAKSLVVTSLELKSVVLAQYCSTLYKTDL